MRKYRYSPLSNYYASSLNNMLKIVKKIFVLEFYFRHMQIPDDSGMVVESCVISTKVFTLNANLNPSYKVENTLF